MGLIKQMVGERAHWEYLDALGGLENRNTSHTRRGLPGLSHPRRPPRKLAGKGDEKQHWSLVCPDLRRTMKTTSQKAFAGDTQNELAYDHNHDGVDRRGFLKCMAWAGTGALCVIRG